jgi:membrane protease YdiL (CAAX protease family)
MAIEVLFFLPALALVVLANYTEKRRNLVVLTQIFLLLLVVMTIAGGFLFSALNLPSFGFGDLKAFGFGIFITGLASLIFFLKNVRMFLSRLIPIDPGSWLHATGLVFATMLVGFSLATTISIDIGSMAEGMAIDMATIIFQGVFFVLLSLLGVGWLTRKKLRSSLERLGLEGLTIKQFLLSLGFLGLIFAVLIIISAIALVTDPGLMEGADDTTIQLLGGRITLLIALIVSLSAGIGEEILFRGATQPRFGIYLTAFVFAISHVQYPSLLALAIVFAAGVILGFERKIVNTTACVITHSLFNFIQLAAVAVLSS